MSGASGENPGSNKQGLTDAVSSRSHRPSCWAAAHMTMGKNFDMDELFQHLATTQGNKGKTTVRHAGPGRM